MIDLSTGRFTFGQGKEVYPGMKLEDFKKTAMFENELKHPHARDVHNNIYYSLTEQHIDGFDIEVCLVFEKQCDRLKRIEFSTKEFYSWPNWPENHGPSYDYEFEKSILAKLNSFLASQIGTIEGGRELSFSYDWGKIESVFYPFHAHPHDPDIKIFIKYDIYEYITPNPEFVEQARQSAMERGMTEEQFQAVLNRFKKR